MKLKFDDFGRCLTCLQNPCGCAPLSKSEQFYDAWWWLEENHEWVCKNLCIDVMKVDPETCAVMRDKKRNTKIDIWLETGPDDKMEIEGREPFTIPTHDINLDCGGDTFEEAVVELAKLVKKFYPCEDAA